MICKGLYKISERSSTSVAIIDCPNSQGVVSSCDNYYSVAHKISSRFLKCIHYNQQFLFSDCVVSLCSIQGLTSIVNFMEHLFSASDPIQHLMTVPLASHITSNGSTQFRRMITYVDICFSLKILKAFRQASSKVNFTSLSNNLHMRCATLQKSLMKLLQNSACPRKLRTPFTQIGGGNFQSPQFLPCQL